MNAAQNNRNSQPRQSVKKAFEATLMAACVLAGAAVVEAITFVHSGEHLFLSGLVG